MAVTRGTSDVEFGDIAEDGGVATVWETVGAVYADETASLTQADPTTKDFMSIQSDQPLDKDVTQGALTLNMSVMDMTPDKMVDYFGGAVTGSGDAKVWEAPLQAQTIEKSIRIVPKKGFYLTFVRVQISAKAAYNLQKDGLFTAQLLLSVLKPDKANTGPWKFGPKVA
ncbi:hypothetical protein [Dyadobacter bucti]|uniref:hypothetical protein n=1 Tax=Dyadobacter bucti TaxID=2572203 RepID=UPI0011095710|nr:hypothetical protein [Dyadobacter bucti]